MKTGTSFYPDGVTVHHAANEIEKVIFEIDYQCLGFGVCVYLFIFCP